MMTRNNKQAETAISVKNVSKSFSLPHEKQGSVKGMFVSMFNDKRTYEKQQVLKDISFDIKKGEFFGIVGRNGSGKSTLLKLISQIYTPDEGNITVNGKLVPFIELGVGFNSELSGRDNVYLNGALLGFSRDEIEELYNEIVEFAELERFMDQKLKNYSSGMQVRLAFSIAIRANTDILVLDEVLAVGDEAFQRKCLNYFVELKRNNKTVILVTHDMSSVEKYCDRAMLIEKGEVLEYGGIESVTNRYHDLLNPNIKQDTAINHEDKKRWGDHNYKLKNVKVSGIGRTNYGSTISICADLSTNNNKSKELTIAFAIKDDSGKVLFGDKHKIRGSKIPVTGKTKRVQFNFSNILSSGKYLIDLSILSTEDNTYSDIWLDCGSFNITNKDGTGFTVINPSELLIL